MWLIDLASSNSLDVATLLGPIDREGCHTWSQVTPLAGSLAVVERCSEGDRHRILGVDPSSGEVVEVLAEREGPIISLEAGPDRERFVYVTDISLDRGGTLHSWAGEPQRITDEVFAAGW